MIAERAKKKRIVACALVSMSSSSSHESASSSDGRDFAAVQAAYLDEADRYAEGYKAELRKGGARQCFMCGRGLADRSVDC